MTKETTNKGKLSRTSINKVLKERARILQDGKVETEQKGKHLNTLVFYLSNERYAIDSNFISEVIRIKELTPLPCTPEFILGIINIRGEILSVIDIKKFFNLPEQKISGDNRLIIVKYKNISLGILTDEIIGNREIYLDTIQKNLSTVTEVPDNFIIGLSEDRLIVLDIKALLSSEKIIVNEEA